MADLGRLAIDLEANIVRFEQGLNRAEQIARKQSRAIEKSLSGIDVAMARVNADSARMASSIDKVSSQVDALSQTTSRYIQLAAGMFAAGKLEAFARASVMAASRYNVLGTVLQTIGRNAGYTADQLGHVETALQQSGISKLESRQGVARMVQGGLDLSLAPKLARIAQDAAVIGNMGSSQAFNHLLYGIQTAQVDMLRTIGINVSFENSYKDLAKSIGVTAESLTEQEKTQARVNAVMRAGESIAGAYSAAMQEPGKQLGSMQRLVSDLQVTLGQGLMPQFRSGIATATQGLEAIQNHADGVATSLGAIGTALAGLVTGRLAGAASRRVQQLAASQSALLAERDAILQTASAATFEATQMARAAAVERTSAETKYQTATAAKTLAVEELQLAQAEQARVTAQYELIRFSQGVSNADEAMAAAAARVTIAEEAVTAAVDARAIATQTLGTAIQLQNRAEVTAEAATLGYAAAQRNAAAAAGAMGLASRAAGAALSFLGGPIGVASLAIVGLIAYWDELSAAMDNAASQAELSAKRIQTAMAKSDMAGLQQEAGAARRDYDQRNAAYDAFAKRALRPGEFGFQKESDRKAMLAGLETARERLLAADQAVRQLKQRQLVTANSLAETDSRKHLGDGKSRLAAQIDQMAKETETKGEKLTAKLATLKRALVDGVIDQSQYNRLAAREKNLFADHGAIRQAHTVERRAAAAKKKVERYQALIDDLLGKTLHGVDPQYGDNLKLLQGAFSQGKIGAADYGRAVQKLTDTQTELGRQTVLFGQRITEVKANLGSAFGQQQLDWQSNLQTQNLSTRAKEIEQGLQHIGQQAVNLKRRLTEDVKLNLIDPQKMQAGLAEIDTMVAAQQQKYLAYQNARRAQEADASNGAKQALADYVAAGENAAGLMEQAFNSAFCSMDAMISKFVTTGEFSFKQLANSILADIARVAERMAMTRLFQWMGIGSGITGIPVQAHANGGTVSGAGTATSDSILSWLSNGEYVIKAAAVSRYGRGFFDALNAGRFASGGAVGSLPSTPAVTAASGCAVQNNVTINVSSNGPADTSSDTDLGRTLADKLVPMINKVVQDQMQQQNRDSWRNGGINRQMSQRGRS